MTDAVLADEAIAGEVSPLLPELLAGCREALEAAEGYRANARQALAALVAPEGRPDNALMEREQFAAHGYAWLATYVAALTQMLDWAEKLHAENRLRELEALFLQAAFGEYLQQLTGGLAISQVEIFRPGDLGLGPADLEVLDVPAVTRLVTSGNSNAVRMRIAELLQSGRDSQDFGRAGLGDETLEMVREQFRAIANDHSDAAHEWHRRDELIPMSVVQQLSELGVFGLTVPEEYGGLGLGKTAMCVVTEELSRGYIGLGSLGTRSEIAAELIRLGGTEAQKEKWLPLIASGELLPTAVFTEPGTGSDLGSLKTRAQRDGDLYKITGNKTWITHAARSDIMTLLARSKPEEPGYRGLSMFIAEKPRGSDADPFPASGMTGGEIRACSAIAA